MVRVRIYTENIRFVETIGLAKKHFPAGFSVTTGKGFWGDAEENTLIVEVLTDDYTIDTAVQAFCFDVKRDNRQKCCLVTRETVDAFTV